MSPSAIHHLTKAELAARIAELEAMLHVEPKLEPEPEPETLEQTIARMVQTAIAGIVKDHQTVVATEVASPAKASKAPKATTRKARAEKEAKALIESQASKLTPHEVLAQDVLVHPEQYPTVRSTQPKSDCKDGWRWEATRYDMSSQDKVVADGLYKLAFDRASERIKAKESVYIGSKRYDGSKGKSASKYANSLKSRFLLAAYGKPTWNQVKSDS